MSRIGKRAIPLSDAVTVTVDGQNVAVKGPKATLEHILPEQISAVVEEKLLLVKRVDDSRQAKAMHGLSRTLLSNMIEGVVTGFKKELEIIGVGYRAQVRGTTLVLNLGYSNPVEYEIPAGVTIAVNDNVRIVVEGSDKQQVGQVSATIRGFRPPEPYKGKGIRYRGEYILLKQGKTV